MSMPQFPKVDPPLTREDVINQIISSIAMEELGLSHIINAEGEKIQYALGTIDGMTGPIENLTLEDLLKLNDSVHETLNSTMMNQFFLKEKLAKALSSAVIHGPAPTFDIKAEPLAPDATPTAKITEDPDKPNLWHIVLGIPSGKAPTPTFDIKAEQLESNEIPTATIVRDDMEPDLWNIVLGIPKGEQGQTPTVDIGKVTAVTFATGAHVFANPTSTGVELDFEIPAGPQGDPGADGKNGDSAFDIAVNNGFDGTEEEWLEYLKGEKGEPGADGKDGDSAFDIAVNNGFDGTEEEWLEYIKGEKGDPGVDGKNGDSAFDIAVNNGFDGTEEEWLEHLKGEKGDPGADGKNGDSAFDIAVNNGFDGTEEEWLETLVGPAGADGQPGTFDPSQKLFTVSAGDGVEDVLFEKNLGFVSKTLDITVEEGPIIRIEKRSETGGAGAIIPFASGDAELTINTGFNGGRRNYVAAVGFGHAKTISAAGVPYSPFELPINREFAFQVPVDCTVTALSVTMTVWSPSGVLGHTSYIRASLYSSDAMDNVYHSLHDDTKIEFSFDGYIGVSAEPKLFEGSTGPISVFVPAGTKLLLIFEYENPTYTLFTSSVRADFSGGLRLE